MKKRKEKRDFNWRKIKKIERKMKIKQKERAKIHEEENSNNDSNGELKSPTN
jgi:hypothetical protein